VSAASSPSLPPGPPYPRWLQTLGWILRPGPFMTRCRERYGDMFTLRVAHEGTWVLLADPDAVKQVFTGDPNVLRAGAANVVLEPVVGRRSVLLLDEPDHMRQRKLMLPPFHGERMQRYGELMRDVARAEIERWPAGEALRLWPSMQAITLEVIMRAVFGVNEIARLEQLREALRSMLDWTTERRRLAMLAALGPARMRGTRTFQSTLNPVDELVFDEIRRRREDQRLEQRDDILSMLVQARYEDGGAMTEEELRDELMTLLVAGHETTATSLAWALERLMRHPPMIDRLRDELTAGEDEYLDAVIKETLRLRPVLPIVVRMLTEPTEIGGRLLPAGVAVAPCIYLIHRRADVYPEPERFRPERFLESPAGTYTWIPFGGGVRRCLGASFAIFEMKTVLAEILSRVELTPPEIGSEPVVRRAITLTPGRGARAIVAERAGATDGATATGGATADREREREAATALRE
jgi:cytochrome P450 family 135